MRNLLFAPVAAHLGREAEYAKYEGEHHTRRKHNHSPDFHVHLNRLVGVRRARPLLCRTVPIRAECVGTGIESALWPRRCNSGTLSISTLHRFAASVLPLCDGCGAPSTEASLIPFSDGRRQTTAWISIADDAAVRSCTDTR